MSLVNDMLRDLEKRKAAETNSETAPGVTRESMIEPKRSSLKKKDIALLSLLVIVASLLAYILLGGKPSKSVIVGSEQVAENGISSPLPVELERNDSPAKAKDNQQSKSTGSLNQLGKEQAAAKVERPEVEITQATNDKPAPTNQSKQKKVVVSKPIEPKEEQSKQAALQKTPPKPANKERISQTVDKHKAAPQEKAKSEGSSSVNNNARLSVAPESKAASQRVRENQSTKSVNTEVENSQARQESKTLNVALSPSALDLKTASDAISLFGLGKSEDAYALLKRFIVENITNDKSTEVLANRLLLDNRSSELSDLFDETGGSLSPGLRQVKARWYLMQGKSDAALVLMEEGQADIDREPEYYALLASLYQRTSQSEKAFEQYSRLIQTNDTVADWWAGLGVAADQLGQGRQAAYAYQQALSLPGLNRALDQYIRQRSSALSGRR